MATHLGSYTAPPSPGEFDRTQAVHVLYSYTTPAAEGAFNRTQAVHVQYAYDSPPTEGGFDPSLKAYATVQGDASASADADRTRTVEADAQGDATVTATGGYVQGSSATMEGDASIINYALVRKRPVYMPPVRGGSWPRYERLVGFQPGRDEPVKRSTLRIDPNPTRTSQTSRGRYREES